MYHVASFADLLACPLTPAAKILAMHLARKPVAVVDGFKVALEIRLQNFELEAAVRELATAPVEWLTSRDPGKVEMKADCCARSLMAFGGVTPPAKPHNNAKQKSEA